MSRADTRACDPFENRAHAAFFRLPRLSGSADTRQVGPTEAHLKVCMLSFLSVHADRYRVLRLIKKGGMAEVLEARVAGHEGFERKIALKRLRSDLSNDPSFVRSFIDEARIVSQLHHANIVGVFDFGFLDGTLFQALELVEGLDLVDLRGRAESSNLRV